MDRVAEASRVKMRTLAHAPRKLWRSATSASSALIFGR
jgi:hypothetical protein